jgi:hypothetical protein
MMSNNSCGPGEMASERKRFIVFALISTVNILGTVESFLRHSMLNTVRNDHWIGNDTLVAYNNVERYQCDQIIYFLVCK